VAEGLEGVNREAFLEGVRSRLRSWHLRSKVPSPWDVVDITSYSLMFWRARIVSYESYEAWGTLYLRVVYRPRLVRLVVPMLGLTPVLLWYPVLGVGVLVGLLTVALLDGWLFARRVHRTLVKGR
jgi:hypothetical protein